MRRLYMLQIGIVLLTSVVLAQKDIKPPETFTASAQVLGNNAGSSAQVTIQINQYTSDKDRDDDPGGVADRRLSGLPARTAQRAGSGLRRDERTESDRSLGPSAADREGAHDLDRD